MAAAPTSTARQVIELQHCLGPMLPVEEFDAPEAMRERFRCSAAPARRRGASAALPALELVSARRAAGQVGARRCSGVPQSAPFFADHFPRRPVFPATLLLDSQIRLALGLAREAIGAGIAARRSCRSA